MVRDSGKSSPRNPEALFSATEAPVPSSPLFWTRLLTQRPWMLLGGLWLVLVCIAAVASHRLLFTDPANARGATQTQSEVATSGRSSEVSRSAQPGDGASAQADPSPAQSGAAVALWGISSLVGVCALGSVVISQQAKAAARRRPKRRVRRVQPKAKAKAPTGPKRLQPYSPDRDAVIVKGAQAVRDTLPLSLAKTEAELDFFDDDLFDDNSTDTPQGNSLNNAVFAPPAQPPRQGQPNQGQPRQGQQSNGQKPPIAPQPLAAAQPPTPPPDSATPHPTEVLPQDETHPLDWTEDSLAHTLDLRQRRSLSSLM